MQVLSAPLRALLFCFEFIFGKGSKIKLWPLFSLFPLKNYLGCLGAYINRAIASVWSVFFTHSSTETVEEYFPDLFSKRLQSAFAKLIAAIIFLLCNSQVFAFTKSIDSFTYSSNSAAQSAWIAQNGSAPVTMSDSGSWGATRRMMLPCNSPTQSEQRCYYDHTLGANLTDLSSFKRFQLDVYIPDPTVVCSLTIYFKSGAGWYWSSVETKLGAQTLNFYDTSPNGTEGTPVGWNNISLVRISAWACPGANTTPSQLAIGELRAVKSAVNIIQTTSDSASVAYALVTSKFLDQYNIFHNIISTSNVEAGALANTTLAILPYNPTLSSATLTALESYVTQGGKLIAHYVIDSRIQQLLGVSITDYIYNLSQFTDFYFVDQTIPGLPAKILQNSWNIEVAQATGVNHSRVLANWNDYAGQVGKPAWIMSDNGLYMSHVLVNDGDLATKAQMLFAMTGFYVPEAVIPACEKAINDIGKIGEYTTYVDAVAGIRTREGAIPTDRIPLVESALGSADSWVKVALQNRSVGQYVQATLDAGKARADMRQAYALAQTTGSAKEFRGIWSDTGTGPYPGDWNKSTKRLANSGFNAVLPNMATGGVAHFNSAVMPHSADFNKYGDQLAAAIDAGHRNGIKVHAWAIHWNLVGAEQTFINQMIANGRTQPGEAPGTYWLSPCDQRNRDLEKATLLEMANNYEIDGLHLDHIRFPWAGFSDPTSCRDRFETETRNKVNAWPDDVIGTGSLKSAYDTWRPTVITSFVHEIHDAIVQLNKQKLRAGKPLIKLSAAVFSDPVDAPRTVGQDWLAWVNDGIIDVLHPMDYGSDLAEFNRRVANQLNVVAGRVPVYPGIGIASEINTDGVISHIQATRGSNPLGLIASGFTHYNFSTEIASSYLPMYKSGVTSNRVAQTAELAISLTADKNAVGLFQLLSYTISVTNNGPDTATTVVVNDWLPSGTSLISATASQGNCTGIQTISCSIGDLPIGSVATINLVVLPTSPAVINNQASVYGDGTDPNTTNNSVSVTTAVTQASQILP